MVLGEQRTPCRKLSRKDVARSLLGCSGDLVRLFVKALWGLVWFVMQAYRGYLLDLLTRSTDHPGRISSGFGRVAPGS